MPPKAQRGVPAGTDEKSLTAENFEKELKALAAKAKEETTFKSVMRSVAIVFQAAQILVCAAIYSNISQLNLSPVYGSIPASLWHSRLVITACLLGWSGNVWLQRNLPRKPLHYLAPMAFTIPMIQHYLFMLSSYLGPTFGPVITELLTFVPLLVVSGSAVALMLEDLDLSGLPKSVAEAAPGIGTFLFFRVVEQFSWPYIRNNIGANILQTRIGSQVVLGAIFARLAPSTLLLFSLPGLFHTAFLNPHVHSSFALFDLNLKLDRSVGFKVLARQDSVTGYISVVENTKEGFRVLRCDHSLLGGIWLPKDGDAVAESIYGVFSMLEAVRLIEVKRTASLEPESALVIGLGIGTTPSALISHGISTTTVEIDPIVCDYALEYFSLPKSHKPVVADAVTYTSDLATQGTQKYDYIVHDVFTGGAEPVDLFTYEFLSNLHKLMKPEGVIAINYAGDLLLPSARLVVRTITSIFPTCRIYREYPSPDTATLEAEKRDFTNVVIFCTLDSSRPLTFRAPVEADYLGSDARRMFLMPKHEIDAWEVFAEREGDGLVLAKNSTRRLEQWQKESAVGHWRVMRTVLPDKVWEMW